MAGRSYDPKVRAAKYAAYRAAHPLQIKERGYRIMRAKQETLMARAAAQGIEMTREEARKIVMDEWQNTRRAWRERRSYGETEEKPQP